MVSSAPRWTLFLVPVLAWAADAPPTLDQRFASSIKPFVAAYCIGCHGDSNPAAQFNLRQYNTTAEVVRDHSRWALVAEKLAHGEMPPKGMKQPPAEDRQKVVDWVVQLRNEEARRNAGDPGLVQARRLSNAEYNYSIRDLTGVDIRPTREFPVDPSNASGFDNSAGSLVMSPALLNKYLQAAREVSTHLVLQPVGLGFAPHPVMAISDREKYTIKRIVDFYLRQPTDFADYFQAAWQYKHRAALGKPNATLADVARDAKVSPKYLTTVWDFLETPAEDVGPVARLQLMWKRLPGPNHKEPELLRVACVKMRDYAVHIRKLTTRQFRSPSVDGLSGTSQPLMNWKLRAYAATRREFDPAALQVEGEEPMKLPKTSATSFRVEDSTATRNGAIAARLRFGDPELMVPAGQRARYEASFAHFAKVFPNAFYIKERGRFYPDDSEDKGRLLSAGFHNVMGYFRDDTPLLEMILDEQGQKELETLWLEFDTVADYTTRTYVQFYFNQSGEIDGRGVESGSFRQSDAEVTTEKVIFGIRDRYLAKAQRNEAEPVALEAIREHFARVNAQIRKVEKARLDAEPTHLDALLKFAERAYRRPLTDRDRTDLLAYYKQLRDDKKLTHDDAMRDMIVLVLMSPDFCYRLDLAEPQLTTSAAPRPAKPAARKARVRNAAAVKAPVEKFRPLSDVALASRLSYFLWSTLPDDELLAHAKAGDLHQPEVLTAQVRRMVKDPRSVALATEFAGNWLGYRRFENHNGVDRGRFPEFTNNLRDAMFQEPVRFIDDLIRNDGSMLDMLYGKHTFVNRTLARHYGIPNDKVKPREWTRIENAAYYGRGGILPMAVFLTKNSPGLRTSPVKRGYWVARQVLGEVIPPPPPSVPELPNDEAKMNLPLRQMLAKHRENPSCAGCHQRFDSFGLAFEGFGPTGEERTKDLAGRAVDTNAEFPGGSQGKGVTGLVDYIRKNRQDDFISNLCRKLTVYALGRDLQLSDEPLLDAIRSSFVSNGHKISTLIESVVVSPQFLNQRNPDFVPRKGD